MRHTRTADAGTRIEGWHVYQYRATIWIDLDAPKDQRSGMLVERRRIRRRWTKKQRNTEPWRDDGYAPGELMMAGRMALAGIELAHRAQTERNEEQA
ncbi:MAG: hypothetical protein OXG72_09420 [Acidobacteria bacterium]|nr:hypothetical protein [Acidobacteriota bacterium]